MQNQNAQLISGELARSKERKSYQSQLEITSLQVSNVGNRLMVVHAFNPSAQETEAVKTSENAICLLLSSKCWD